MLCFDFWLLVLISAIRCSAFHVTPSVSEPVPGWVDNLNGPIGVIAGAAKGVIRSMLVDGSLRSEFIPVDFAISGLITIPYDIATAKEKSEQIPCYNITAADYRKRPWKHVMDLGRKLNAEYPFEVGLWYPDGNFTTNKFVHTINHILFMWLPAYFIDFLLLIAGQKRFMVRVQRRIAIGLDVLQFFTTRQWDFKSDKYVAIWSKLSSKDKDMFNMDMSLLDDEEYLKCGLLGARQYTLKEPLSSIPAARRNLRIMYVVDRLCKFAFLGYLLYWLCTKLGFFDIVATNPQKIY